MKVVECIEDAFIGDKKVFTKGKVYKVEEVNGAYHTKDDFGDLEVYDPNLAGKKEIFDRYFKVIA